MPIDEGGLQRWMAPDYRLHGLNNICDGAAELVS
jgi:hypothetical protein